MATIKCAIQGESPLLMNRFTEQDAAKVSAGTSLAITSSRRGTPREQAEPRLYTSASGAPILPGPNVFRGLIDAGQFHKIGRRQVTSAKSSLVPAGIQLVEIECPIINPFGGKPEWEVDSRSVVNPSTGGRMMCHRPRFDAWKIEFTLKIDDDRMFDEALCRSLVEDLGRKIGLGDFRPARNGPFGRSMIVNWKYANERTKIA